MTLSLFVVRPNLLSPSRVFSFIKIHIRDDYDDDNNNNNNNHHHHHHQVIQPSQDQSYQPSARHISTCPQTEVKDHLSSLEVTCCQHAEASNRCWLSQTRITATNQYCSVSSRWWVDIHPSCRESNPKLLLARK